MTENYMNLYIAIWTNAVYEETRYQKHRLHLEVAEKTFPNILKYTKEKRDTMLEQVIREQYGVGGLNVLKALEKIISSKEDKLVQAVKEKIIEETYRWPLNTKSKDKNFERKYAKIKQEICSSSMEVVA